MADLPQKFKPGQPRPANAGRKKGTPNKRTYEFMTTLNELDFNPAEKLVHIYNEAMKIFDTRKKHNNLSAAGEMLSLAQRTAGDLAQYAFPKKKAIEHSGEVGVKTFSDFIKAAEKKKDD